MHCHVTVTQSQQRPEQRGAFTYLLSPSSLKVYMSI